MSSESTETAPNPLPVWLSIPVILVCLAGGGWIIHWYVMTDPISHEARILGDAPAAPVWQGGPRQVGPGGNRNRVALQRRGVLFDQNSGTVQLRTEAARGSVVVANGKANVRFIGYISYSFLPGDAAQTIAKARNLVPDQKRTEALKLDVHQVSTLRSLGNYPPMEISPADKASLESAVEGYAADARDRTALEPKLLQQFDDIATRSMEATKQAAVARAAQIDKIVTPEMWKQDASMGGAGK